MYRRGTKASGSAGTVTGVEAGAVAIRPRREGPSLAITKGGSVMSQTDRRSVQNRYEAFVSGIAKRLVNVPSLFVAGVTYTPSSLTTLFQSIVDRAAAVATAETQLRDARKALRDVLGTTVMVAVGFRHAMRNMFGEQAEALADFGLAPPRVHTPTVEQKASSVAKGKATRQARHTMGKKQKAEIKGSVSTPTPVAPTPKA
jgi:hypothetical protein